MRLLLRMARLPVALPLLVLLLFPAALHGGLGDLGWRHAAAALAILASYVAATTVNDLADVELDRVNLPRRRVLVTGEATRRDLVALHVAASAAALALAHAAASWPGLGVMAASLGLNLAYSAPPLRLSYRTHLAHPALAAGYALAPYALGLAVEGAAPGPRDALLAGGLLLLYWGRLLLKDLRDRAGDAAGGKRTFLLRHGKPATCAASGGLLASGALLVLAALPLASPWPALAPAALALAALGTLRRLREAPEGEEEQRFLGIGAKLGNGVLLASLALLALADAGAAAQALVAGTIAALFLANAAFLHARPERVDLAYRG